jgi:hypothetical protein
VKWRFDVEIALFHIGVCEMEVRRSLRSTLKDFDELGFDKLEFDVVKLR